LLGRRRGAQTLLFLGVTVTVAARALERSFIDAAGVVAVANPSLLSAVLWPIVFPLVLGLATSSGSSREPERRTAA
jgi:cell shape-determining protein MreD